MTTDTPDRNEDAALAAEYALGLLSPAETLAFESRMVSDPELRALHARWAEDFAALADAIPEVTPPNHVQTALNARLFPEKRQSWLRRIGLIPALFGGLVAALLVVWATNQGILQPDPFTTPRYVAEITAIDQSLILQASFDPVDGTLQIDRAKGSARSGRVLELWLIAGDNAPVSLGVLPDSESVALTVDASLLPAMPGGTLAISDEPPGGSTTGAPTGEVLATGVVTTL
jgi:anti-sigma-K factor RskA